MLLSAPLEVARTKAWTVAPSSHERVGEMRAHEPVGAGHEDGATLVGVSEVVAEVVERGACPEGVVRHGPYASASVSKRTDSSGAGSAASAALTAASTLVVSGFAASSAFVIAREFGRTDETDGFFAAYGVFIVIIDRRAGDPRRRPTDARPRPRGTAAGRHDRGVRDRAHRDRGPVLVLGEVAGRPHRRPSHGRRARCSRRTRAPMPSDGCCRRLSRISSRDWRRAGSPRSTTTRRLPPATRPEALPGSLSSCRRSTTHGIVGGRVGHHAQRDHCVSRARGGTRVASVRHARMPVPRCATLGRAAAPRVSVCSRSLPRCRLRFNSSTSSVCRSRARLGPGAVTSFGYAYLAAASLVTITAFSIGLVSSVPLDSHRASARVRSVGT